MIDLRSPNDMLDHYVERYDHLLPAPSAQLLQRMDYMRISSQLLTYIASQGI
ncbi:MULTISPECIES: hypothetical protein [Pseudomonas]|uniref:Crystallin J1 n=2 Tax=Pseudomonas syringae TaxID=317 RepID=A0A0P9GZM5_PSESX|nr:crystallin J1 [Pseudomonas syringae pv. atrofaciens]ELP96768.1 ADP-ribosylation/crystallin J1 [Pseudomonas syringae BRIP34881]ELP99297.1 ADP-ribosylation/crystallin J1 [Pseudomonas syringae BRIP34876]KPY97740.1 ADP-ribosylation/crystallin J1 [Pseudomonas syringae pv. aptata]MBI6672672.1 crystallin J1 [Pseudomonas syringae]